MTNQEEKKAKQEPTFEVKWLKWVQVKIAEDTQKLEELEGRLEREQARLAELLTREAAGEGAYLWSFAENCQARIGIVENNIAVKRHALAEWREIATRGADGGWVSFEAVAAAWQKWIDEADRDRKSSGGEEGAQGSGEISAG